MSFVLGLLFGFRERTAKKVMVYRPGFDLESIIFSKFS